jgi:hypothetical protein
MKIAMKQKIYYLGLVTVILTITGSIFKINHWPGAAVLLIAGLSSMALLFTPAALVSHYRNNDSERNLLLYIVTGITAFVVFTGMLFKILHWPYAGYILMLALPLPYIVFLPVFLYTTAKKKNFSIYYLVFVLCLLAFSSVFNGLLSLNVSKERIDDSYSILRNYSAVELALLQTEEKTTAAVPGEKIDQAVAVARDYKIMILRSEGLDPETWDLQPGNLKRPDTGAAGGQVLQKAEGLPVGARLGNSIEKLQEELASAEKYSDLLNLSQEILNNKYPPVPEQDWVGLNFIDNNLPWSLMYLDALQTNLTYMKWSLHSPE